MKFLILSDIHGDLEKLDALDARFKEADAVLFGGDYARFEHEETGKPVLDKLLSKHENIFSVIFRPLQRHISFNRAGAY